MDTAKTSGISYVKLATDTHRQGKKMQLLLETRDLTNGSREFLMESIEVDGIQGKRPNRVYPQYFFSLKYETDERDQPQDTGYQWHYRPDIEMSERHWLKCGNVIPKHSTCYECGERDLDD